MRQRFVRILMPAVLVFGRSIVAGAFLLGCLIILNGCRSIDSQPFQQFAQAVEQSSQSVDHVLHFNQQLAQQDFIKNFPRQAGARLSALKLNDTSPGSLNIELKPPPLFIAIAQSRKTMQRLNSAFERYVQLLAALSEPALIKSGDFRQLSSAINHLGTDVVKATDSRLPSAGIKLLSQSAVRAMMLYLRHRRRTDLQHAITANQDNISKYAAAALTILRLTDDQLKVYYSKQAGELVRQWRAANYRTRVKLVRDMLKLNMSYARVREIMTALQQFYRTMPQANAALADSITRPASDLEALAKLNRQADTLKRLNKTLSRRLLPLPR